MLSSSQRASLARRPQQQQQYATHCFCTNNRREADKKYEENNENKTKEYQTRKNAIIYVIIHLYCSKNCYFSFFVFWFPRRRRRRRHRVFISLRIFVFVFLFTFFFFVSPNTPIRHGNKTSEKTNLQNEMKIIQKAIQSNSQKEKKTVIYPQSVARSIV